MSARDPDRDEKHDGREPEPWPWPRGGSELDEAFEPNVRAAREAVSGDLDHDPWLDPPAEARPDDVNPC